MPSLQIYLDDPKRVLLFSSGKASLSRELCSAMTPSNISEAGTVRIVLRGVTSSNGDRNMSCESTTVVNRAKNSRQSRLRRSISGFCHP
jgi:hypothetical protein